MPSGKVLEHCAALLDFAAAPVRVFMISCHKQCFKGSNDGTPIPPCMGYRIGVEENPFGTGAKDEL